MMRADIKTALQESKEQIKHLEFILGRSLSSSIDVLKLIDDALQELHEYINTLSLENEALNAENSSLLTALGW